MKFVRRPWQKWLFGIVVLLLLLAAGFVIWGSTPLGPMPEAYLAVKSDARMAVSTTGRWLSFEPLGANTDTGLIFYPGGRVDYLSYAPEARQIASYGYLVVIVPMPLNLAVFGADKAAEVIAAYPTIKHWAIGGHSLGGSMAARFAFSHPGAVQGLVLWASYPASTDDLSKSSLAVASIFGTNDGLATAGKIDASRPLLPAHAQYVPIQGGNHGQFGWYGQQGGDNPASIDRIDQQDQTVAATVAVLQKIQGQ